MTPELVADRWAEITSMEAAESFGSHQEAAGEVMARIAGGLQGEEDAGEKGIKDAIGFVSEPYIFEYSFKEAILYALSVGVSTKDQQGLRWDPDPIHTPPSPGSSTRTTHSSARCPPSGSSRLSAARTGW